MSNYKRFRLWGVPLIGLIMYCIFFIINPDEEPFFLHFSSLNFKAWSLEIVYVIIFALLVFELTIFTSKILDKYVPWELNSRKRFFLQLFFQVIAQYLLITILFQIEFFKDEPDYFADILIYRQTLVISIFLSLLITSIFTSEYFLNRWSIEVLEKEKLKQDVLKSELEVVKSQINPHFLFNNFSTLSSLIDEDSKTANLFLKHLSKVYRYVLDNSTKDFIAIENEIEFIKNYLQLYHYRFGEAIKVSISIHQLNKQVIPTLTLQLLVENAIKHTIISLEKPLHIEIYEANNQLIVKNNLQQKLHKEPSTQLGIENIKSRFRLLNMNIPTFMNDGIFYTVTLTPKTL